MATIAKIYIDSCCLIQAAKGSVGPKGCFSEKDLDYIQLILKAGQNKHVKLFTSSITVAECLHAGDGNNIPEEVKRTFRSVLTSGQILILKDADTFVVERARDMRWENGINLKVLDSIHVASAIELGCQEFWTGDHFGNKSGVKWQYIYEKLGLRVVSPSNTILLPHEYKQKGLFSGSDEKPPKVRRLKVKKAKSKFQGVSKKIVDAAAEMKLQATSNEKDGHKT